MLAFVFHIKPCPGACIPSRMEIRSVGCSWCLCVPNTHTEGGKGSEQGEILHNPTGGEGFDNTNGLVGSQFCCPLHTEFRACASSLHHDQHSSWPLIAITHNTKTAEATRKHRQAQRREV